MSTILKGLGLALCAVLVVVLIVMFGAFFLAIIGVMILLFGIAWLCNVPFEVKSGDQVIGTYTRKGGFVRKL